MSIIPASFSGDGRGQNAYQPGRLVKEVEKHPRDPVSDKGESEQGHLRLFSDHYAFTIAHVCPYSHAHSCTHTKRKEEEELKTDSCDWRDAELPVRTRSPSLMYVCPGCILPLSDSLLPFVCRLLFSSPLHALLHFIQSYPLTRGS